MQTLLGLEMAGNWSEIFLSKISDFLLIWLSYELKHFFGESMEDRIKSVSIWVSRLLKVMFNDEPNFLVLNSN